MATSHSRRGVLAGAAALAVGGTALADGKPRPEDVELPAGGRMPTRKLGRTGVEVSLIGLGGFHIGQAKDAATAARIIHTAAEHGVTFLDNCWDYNEGRSHEWMGKALQGGFRQKFFLMTKIDGRTRAAAAAQIDQSLAQLGTDTIDLIQIHEVIRPQDPGRVFGPDGAMEALVAAKKAGKIRFIGFTGHKSPTIHLSMLAAARDHEFRYDTVQMPVNVMDAHYQSFGRQVIPVATRDGTAVLGMKPFGSGVFFKSKVLGKGGIDPIACLQYPMSKETSVVITGCDDLGVLMQALRAAYTFDPKRATDDVLAHSAPDAGKGEYEKYKTSDRFDGTAQHPWWLETASLKKT